MAPKKKPTLTDLKKQIKELKEKLKSPESNGANGDQSIQIKAPSTASLTKNVVVNNGIITEKTRVELLSGEVVNIKTVDYPNDDPIINIQAGAGSEFTEKNDGVDIHMTSGEIVGVNFLKPSKKVSIHVKKNHEEPLHEQVLLHEQALLREKALREKAMLRDLELDPLLRREEFDQPLLRHDQPLRREVDQPLLRRDQDQSFLRQEPFLREPEPFLREPEPLLREPFPRDSFLRDRRKDRSLPMKDRILKHTIDQDRTNREMDSIKRRGDVRAMKMESRRVRLPEEKLFYPEQEYNY